MNNLPEVSKLIIGGKEISFGKGIVINSKDSILYEEAGTPPDNAGAITDVCGRNEMDSLGNASKFSVYCNLP